MGRCNAGISFLWDPEYGPCQIDIAVSCHTLGIASTLCIPADAPAIYLATKSAWPRLAQDWRLIRVPESDETVLIFRDGATTAALRFHTSILNDLAIAIEADTVLAQQALDDQLTKVEELSETWTL